MSAAAVVFFVPAVLLLLAGGATIWLATAGHRRRGIGRAALTLRLLAGFGTLGFAAMAVSPLWSDMTYGIVILPVMALLGAAVWNGVLFLAAAVTERIARSRRAV